MSLRSRIKVLNLYRTVTLTMGRSRLTIKKISFQLEIIDFDHVEEILVFISMLTVWNFKIVENIAKILFLPMLCLASQINLGSRF